MNTFIKNNTGKVKTIEFATLQTAYKTSQSTLGSSRLPKVNSRNGSDQTSPSTHRTLYYSKSKFHTRNSSTSSVFISKVPNDKHKVNQISQDKPVKQEKQLSPNRSTKEYELRKLCNFDDYFIKIRQNQKKDTKEFVDLKKQIRSKIHKLMNNNLLYSLETDRKMMKNENKVNCKIVNTKFLTNKIYNYDKTESKRINKSNTIINNFNTKSSRRFEDNFITHDELLFKHFNEKEIQLIKHEPDYTRLRNRVFSDVNFFQRRTLKEALDEEESAKTKNGSFFKKNALKTARASISVLRDKKRKEEVNVRVKEKEINKLDLEIDDAIHKFEIYTEKNKENEKEVLHSKNSIYLLNNLKSNKMIRNLIQSKRLGTYKKASATVMKNDPKNDLIPLVKKLSMVNVGQLKSDTLKRSAKKIISFSIESSDADDMTSH